MLERSSGGGGLGAYGEPVRAGSGAEQAALGGAGMSAAQPAAVAYVALAVEDAERAAAALAGPLGLRRTPLEPEADEPVAVFAVGESAVAVFPVGHALLGEGGSKAGVHHVALASADPEAAVAATGLPRAGGSAFGLAGRRAVAIEPSATAGVRLRYSEPLELEPSAAPLVERIDHLGVASADNAAAVALFHERLGLPLESRQTDREVHVPIESFTSDKYGVVYHSRAPVQRGALEVAFVTVGDFDLEFLSDAEAVGAAGRRQSSEAGSTQQDRGAISRFIERRGPGLHHLALKTPAMEAALQALREAGMPLIDETGRPGSRRAQIAFLEREALGGVVMHLVEREPL